MSFFGDRPVGEPPEQPIHRQPTWAGPQQGVLPGCSNQSRVVFRSELAALGVHAIEVYPNGVTFKATLFLREPRPQGPRRPDHPLMTLGQPDDESVHFGLRFEDGSSWSNLDRRPGWRPDRTPRGPYVAEHGGGGRDDSWTVRYWMWPVPEGETFEVIAAWPKYGIHESSVSLDLGEIRSRLTNAVHLWG